MKSDHITCEQYMELLRALEKQNRDYCALCETKAYNLGEKAIRLGNAVRRGDLKAAQKMLSAFRVRKPIARLGQKNQVIDEFVDYALSDYMLNERIAVYTSVFGNYDRLLEPYIKPDNIDYYVVTDMDIPEDSQWKKRESNHCLQEDWAPAQKNRFAKMHPHLLFPEYDYSIYVDGNVQIVSDLTPLANRIGECGIAAHYHSMRDCVYDELAACVLYKKLTKQEAQKYKEHLETNRMPRHYGLLMCNVLARQHNQICVDIMDDWWQEYEVRVKRDQVSLPYILYHKGIDIKAVATLGKSVFENRLLRVEKHI